MIVSFENRLAQFFALIAIFLAIIVVLFPFFWIFLESVKPPSLGGRPDIWRFELSWENWSEVLLNSSVPLNIMNSFFIALITVVISLIC